MAKKKQLHLRGFAQHGVMNHMLSTWAHPYDKVRYDYARPEYWQDLGRTLERGRFRREYSGSTLREHLLEE